MMAKKFKFNKYTWPMVVGTLASLLFYTYWHFTHEGELKTVLNNPAKIFISIIVGISLTYIQFFLDTILNKLLTWRKYFLLRLTSGISVILLLCTFIVYPATHYNLINTEEELPKLLVIVFMFGIVYQITYGAIYAYFYFSVLQIEKVKSERMQLALQFQSLKNQISPHYLFNCLNTISSLIYKNPHVAEKFIRRMTDTFQYVLGWEKQKLVSLKEELNFVKAYFFLLQARYENQISLDITLPQDWYEKAIPPLTIQLLIENAIKHNDMSVEQPLSIQVKSNKQYIEVSNVIQAKTTKEESLQIGLQNIQQRYSFFTNKKVTISQDKEFIVLLPLLENASTFKNDTQFHEA
jgi:two-component system LytT family sensor kinase